MQENVLAGLDLPQKFLVWQQQDEVFVGYNPPEYIVARYENTENAQEQLIAMNSALTKFASMATGVDSDSIAQSATAVADMTFPSRTNNGVLSVPSNDDFETTRNRLVNALNANGGPNIAFEVDHAANSDGALLGNSYLVVFGNPTIGTPLMQTSPTAGIDLPLKILITQQSNIDGGTVYVSTNMIGYLRHRHNLWPLEEELTTVQNAIHSFVGIAADRNVTVWMHG